MPAIPGLVAKFATDPATVQLTVSLYLLGLAVAQLVFGPLSDRFGRRPVRARRACARDRRQHRRHLRRRASASLIVARVVQSLGASTGQTIGRAIIRDLYDREHAASMIGLVTSVVVLMPMVAPLIGGILDTLFGWESIFIFTAAAQLHGVRLGGAGVAGDPHDSPPRRADEAVSAPTSARWRRARGSSATRCAPGSARRRSSAFSAARPTWW